MNTQILQESMPPCDRWTVREVHLREEEISLDRGVLRAPSTTLDRGAMVTIERGGGEGYAATSDLTPSGLRAAADRAATWAEHAAAHPLAGLTLPASPATTSSYATAAEVPWEGESLAGKIERLQQATIPLRDADLALWVATLQNRDTTTELWTSEGGHHHQHIRQILPAVMLFANADSGGTVRRSLGRSRGAQGGLEVLEAIGFDTVAVRLLDEVKQLACAPSCPEGTLDLLLAPDQMAIQIHESIGHPLELDRMLGDERNFAGTTFVTPEMVGTFQYGSELLNVTFDPTVPGEIASYASDDLGTPAERHRLIDKGLLVRVLGGTLSQARAGLPGVACTRASTWRRPPIDRMANLNVEPGTSTLEDLIAQVEDGVYLQTNLSWSIDDSRDKFQFSAEFGRRIRHGALGEVVRNPGYRGRSKAFWRGLKGVGDAASRELHGTPYCGKGEPNQIVSVGHASPPCLFTDIDVFGGA